MNYSGAILLGYFSELGDSDSERIVYGSDLACMWGMLCTYVCQQVRKGFHSYQLLHL